MIYIDKKSSVPLYLQLYQELKHELATGAATTISLQGPLRSRQTYFFMPVGGEKGMACYTSRTYEERRTIQELWEAGVQAKEIADKLDAPLSSIYSELRRGQDGSRLPNQRMRYNADLAQLRIQQSFERRGRRTGEGPERKGANRA